MLQKTRGVPMKKHLPHLITCLLAATITLSANATDITGVTGRNGVYNIDPTSTSENVGFRVYENFDLSKGDVANLKYQGIKTFVNIVDNKVNIDGIVNTVNNSGGFYDGKAVFISPNGLTVGASGVLNVGSLGVYAASQSQYGRLKGNYTAESFKNFTKENYISNKYYSNGSPIKIQGKIISAGDIDMKGSSVEIIQPLQSTDSGIMYGVNKDAMKVLTTQEQAAALFNLLVNTDGYKSDTNFRNNGKASMTLTIPNNNDVHISSVPIKNFAAYNNFTGIVNGKYYINNDEVSESDYVSSLANPERVQELLDNAPESWGFTGFRDGKYYVYNKEVSKSDYISHLGNMERTQQKLDGTYEFTGFLDGKYYHKGNEVVSNTIDEISGDKSVTDRNYSGFAFDRNYYVNGNLQKGYEPEPVITEIIQLPDPGTDSDITVIPDKITKEDPGKGGGISKISNKLEDLFGKKLETNQTISIKVSDLSNKTLQFGLSGIKGLADKQVTSTPITGGRTVTNAAPGVVINPATGNNDTDSPANGLTPKWRSIGDTNPDSANGLTTKWHKY